MYCCLLFFVFKQKTAYEMRISDWSSDVCSSDLPDAPVTLVYVDDVVERFIELMDGADAAVDAEGFATLTPQYTTSVGELARQIKIFRDSRDTLEIGRASCRERVCQYV